MHRRWRVRHSYPGPVVDLVELLLTQHPVPRLARVLDLPMSVIYRWRARKFGNPACASRRADDETIATLLAKCEQLGFRFTERLSAAELSGCPPMQIARWKISEDATAGAAPLPPPIGGARPAAVSMHGKTAAEARRGTPVLVRARNDVDARPHGTSRGVTRRLEAARRLIDTEYFSDIDSKVLADAAQMSRHHFIRMFSHLFGSTPHQYLIRTRVQAAKRLLLASREPIEVIAAGVGFRSGQSLNRAFKQTEGVSVSKFCSTIGKHESIARRAAPFRAPGQDLAHTRVSDAMTSVASAAFASSSTC
jgi:AraC-like DNA-binding protein